MLLKRIVWLLMVAAALAPAAEKKSGAKSGSKEAKAAAKAVPAPKPGYRLTPFGMVKVDEAAAPVKVEAPVDMKVAEDGDTLRFERVGPFGPVRWTRKKTELTELEQAVWEREKARKPAADKSKE